MTEAARSARREYMRLYRLKNREKLLTYQREYRKQNREKINAQRREWARKHSDDLKKYYESYWERVAKRSE